MKFVVTGCGRSGTRYTAHLLTLSGISCGHEDVVNQWKGKHLVPGWEDAQFDGDSSYIAAPHTAEIKAKGMQVVHLVRPPLDVIRSISGSGWLRSFEAPWVRYIGEHIPEAMKEPPGPKRAAAYWLAWNSLAEREADFHWSTHDISPDDIRGLGDAIGTLVSKKAANNAVKKTSRSIHTWYRRADVTLDDLGDYGPLIEEAAEKYGVPVELGEKL